MRTITSLVSAMHSCASIFWGTSDSPKHRPPPPPEHQVAEAPRVIAQGGWEGKDCDLVFEKNKSTYYMSAPIDMSVQTPMLLKTVVIASTNGRCSSVGATGRRQQPFSKLDFHKTWQIFPVVFHDNNSPRMELWPTNKMINLKEKEENIRGQSMWSFFADKSPTPNTNPQICFFFDPKSQRGKLWTMFENLGLWWACEGILR